MKIVTLSYVSVLSNTKRIYPFLLCGSARNIRSLGGVGARCIFLSQAISQEHADHKYGVLSRSFSQGMETVFPDDWSCDEAPWSWLSERLVVLILNAKTLLAPARKMRTVTVPWNRLLPARPSVCF